MQHSYTTANAEYPTSLMNMLLQDRRRDVLATTRTARISQYLQPQLNRTEDNS